MAPFLSRLFSIQKRFSTNVRSDEQKSESKRVKPPEFDSSKQVRVLLFRELNGQDRRLLFDSKSVRKKDPSASPGGGGGTGGGSEKSSLHLLNRRFQENSIEKSFKLNDNHSKEFVYEWQKSSPDEQMLREMIFGSVSISYQGTTLKVHTIRSPFQIMLSVVFAAPIVPMFRIGEQEAEESGNWTTPANEININKPVEKSDSHLAHSVPVNVPSRLSGHYYESQDSDSDSLQSHDGFNSLPTTTQHLTPETASACLPRSSSYNSLQRRLMHNKATSIEMGLQKPDDGMNTDEFARGSGQKRVKLGLSIVINLDKDKNDERQFTHFVFTHMPLIERHMMSLKETVFRAYLNRRCFVQLMFEGAKKFQQAISDLYTAPRLQNPEWLTIISSPNHRHLSYSFLEKFSHLLRQYDKKETHFFVSTLLTAVLTHHLSWVPSVIPTDSKIQPSQTSHKHTPCWVDLLAKSRPYNPHWVQLNDLYGALGSSLKLSKTVVKGHKKEVILKFLHVLSYFIRCSDICEQLYERVEGSDIDSLDGRLQNKRPGSSECSSLGGASSSKLSSDQTSVNISETCIMSCCTSRQSLPQNLCSHPKSLDIIDTDSASDSSKDTCDVSITPTEERISNGSVESIATTLIESKPVPISSCDSTDCSTMSRGSEPSSLGYVSFQENLVESSKGLAASIQNNLEGISDVASGSSLDINKEVNENSPHISITACSDNDSVKTSDELKRKRCCDCDSCPCFDKPLDACHFTKDLDFRASKIKECESIEEGYHSMEEPHSPGRVRMHLSEMLKQYENWHPEGLEEVPLPELQHSKEVISTSYKSFGWSLMAGITNHYLMDFCLQGLNGPLCEDEIRNDLIQSTNTNILGESVSESVCIVADTDKWSVQLLSSNFVGGEKADSLGVRIVMSSLVSGMCEAILNMCELRIPPESCIIYLEDRLQEIYFRSQMLSDYLRCNRSTIPLTKISSTLNVDMSDMPLLMSVATTHSPYLSVHNR